MKILAAALVLSLVAPAFADPAPASWDAAHPRRAQVNGRLANQNARIHNGVASGKLSPAQAAQLHREDHAIRAEERADAAAHGGHITRGEQRTLDRQENTTSRQIRAEKAGR